MFWRKKTSSMNVFSPLIKQAITHPSPFLMDIDDLYLYAHKERQMSLFIQGEIKTFVQKWFDLLSAHVPVEHLLPMLAQENLEMVFPERTLLSHDDFRDWYRVVGENFTNQEHILEELNSRDTEDGVEINLKVVWKAVQTSDGSHLAFCATQSWLLQKSAQTDQPVTVKYRVHSLVKIQESYVTNYKEVTMTPKEVIDKYYEYANAGDWDSWLQLFAPDTVLDEQLAGHIEGLDALRELMKGIDGYATFQNIPKHIIVSGNEAAVVSHISATTRADASIEAGVMSYFRFDENGKILYFANFHDSVPFKPFLNQSKQKTKTS